MDIRSSYKTIILLLTILLMTLCKYSLQDCTFQPSVRIKGSVLPDSKIFTFPSGSHISLLDKLDQFYVSGNTLYSRHLIKVSQVFTLTLSCITKNKMTVKKDFTITVASSTLKIVKDLSIEIPETTSVNSSVINLSSIVSGTMENNSTVYIIETNSYNNTFTMVDKHKGILQLSRKLDFDISRVYHLTITASDGENAKLIQLNITIMDEDTKPPEFQFLHYYVSVKEEQKELVNTSLSSDPPILAYDGDRSINQTINYRIHKGTKHVATAAFGINKRTGSIIVRRVLDRETKDSYTLYIEAYQTDAPDTKTAIAVIHVIVVDINDNVPKFSSCFHSVEVLENLPNGFFIYQFHATDADKNPFNVFQYQLTDKYNAFQVNSSTGDLTVKNSHILDRETLPTMAISVFAVESTGQESKTCHLKITLKDQNDNWPMFNQQAFLLFASQLKNRTFIGTVNATDLDEGPNAQLKYGLTNIVEWGKQPAPIDVDEDTGDIMTNSFIKPATSYRFFLQACDSPVLLSRRLCSKVPVMVVTKNTTKSKDNSRTRYIYIKENTPNDTQVANLNDDFKGSNVGMIFIHLRTSPVPVKIMKFGEVVVNGLLDYETTQSYNLTVLACTETTTINMTVIIYVKDTNDHIPTFDKPLYVFEVLPKLKVNTTIGYVKATDKDQRAPNNEIFFEIPEEFSIGSHIVIKNKTGEMVVSKNIFLNGKDKNSLEFLVRAADKGVPPLSSLVTIKLLLLDKTSLASYYLSTILLKKEVMTNKRSLERAFTKVIGVFVNIEQVIDGPTDNEGRNLFFGGLVLKHKSDLQKIFLEYSSRKPTPWKFHAPELILLILASLLFVCCLICIGIIYRKRRMELNQQHSLKELHKKASLYDSTDLTLTTDLNCQHESSSVSNRSNRTSITNPNFEFDSDSGRHSNESKTNPADETDTGFQTSTLSVRDCQTPTNRPRKYSSETLKQESCYSRKSPMMPHPYGGSLSHLNLDYSSDKHTYANIGDSSDDGSTSASGGVGSENLRTKNIYDRADKPCMAGNYPESISGLYDDTSDDNMYEIPITVSSLKDRLYDIYDKPDSPQSSNFYDIVGDPSLRDLFRENIDDSCSGSTPHYHNIVTHHYEHINSDSDIPNEPHPDYVTASELSDVSDEVSNSPHGSATTLSCSSISTSHSNTNSELHSINKHSSKHKTLHTILGLLELSHASALSSRGCQARPLPPRDYNPSNNKTSHFNASMTQL
ncbi:cadherin-23-like [Argonauta hians]